MSNNFMTPPKRKPHNTTTPPVNKKSKHYRNRIIEEDIDNNEDPTDPIENADVDMQEQQQQEQQQVEQEQPVVEEVEVEQQPTQEQQETQEQEEGQPPPTLERTDNAELNQNLIDIFNESGREQFSTTTTTTTQPTEEQATSSTTAVLISDAPDDALMVQALNQTEKAIEKAEEAEKKLNIFETALELDVSCHHNLYFKNPVVEQGVITFKHDTVNYGKHKGKSFNNIRIGFSTQEITQGWLQNTFYNLTSITPPGVIELFSPPPFGNLSELKSSKEARKEKVLALDPDHPSKCKWSLLYTSKHFGLTADKDEVEHDSRTRKAYERIQENKKIITYLAAHPELQGVADAVPVEAYEYNQESALTETQMAELSDNEKFSWQSKEVNSWFYWAEQIEKKMFDAVRADPDGFGSEYKKAVLAEIENRYEKALKSDELKNAIEEWEKKPKATRGLKPRPEKEKYETVFNRNMKTLIKTERNGGTKTLRFSGPTLKTATELEKAALKNGTLKGANAVLTQICIENGLVEAYFPIYRFLTEAELKDNPETTSPIALMSVAEAVMWIMQHNNKCIGQVIYSPSLMVINAELMMCYRPFAVLIWNSCDAYKIARTKHADIVRPPPTKRVFAPAPLKLSLELSSSNNNNNFIDTSAFADMPLPMAAKYKKKETTTAITKEGEAAPTAVVPK